MVWRIGAGGRNIPEWEVEIAKTIISTTVAAATIVFICRTLPMCQAPCEDFLQWLSHLFCSTIFYTRWYAFPHFTDVNTEVWDHPAGKCSPEISMQEIWSQEHMCSTRTLCGLCVVVRKMSQNLETNGRVDVLLESEGIVLQACLVIINHPGKCSLVGFTNHYWLKGPESAW